MMHGILGLEKTKSMQDNSVQAPTHSSSVSSDSSEAENHLYENPEEIKTPKVPQTHCKRWVADRNRTQKESHVRPNLCSADKPSLRKNTSRVTGLNKQRHNKRWKKSSKVGGRKNADLNTTSETKFKDCGQEFKEEPQWYTEPLSDNVTSNNLKSKLETAYKSSFPSFDAELLEKLPASIRDLCIDDGCSKDYLWTGAFVDGHFVDIPTLLDKTELSEILDCSKTNSDSLDNLQKSVDLFCEEDTNQSLMDSCGFDFKQGNEILNIGRKNEDRMQFEGEHNVILDGLPLNIWEDSSTIGGVERSSPMAISCTNQLGSDQVNLWLSSTTGSSLINKTGIEPYCKESTPLSDKDDGWPDCSEASEKETYFSIITNKNDAVFSCESNPQSESPSSQETQTSELSATKDKDSVQNESSFSNIYREDCGSWSVLCKSGNRMSPFTLRSIDSVTFPIELNVNMTTGIPTACSEDDLLSLLPGSEYLQLDDSFLIELPVMTSKEKLDITKYNAQADKIETGKWSPIFGICQENLSEKKDNLNSRVIEEIWKATPEEDKAAFSEDGINTEKCHSCSLGTETPMKHVNITKLKKCPLQKSESNFWEDKLGNTQILDSTNVDITSHCSEWQTGSDQTDVSVTGGIEHLMSNTKQSEFSPSENTFPKPTTTPSTLQPTSFTADQKSLINCDLQQNGNEESIEQNIINDISIVLPEDLWGNLNDYLNDSTEPSESSFLPFELSCPVPEMLSLTSTLEIDSDKMNQQPSTIPQVSSDLIITNNDKLQNLIHQDHMSIAAQTLYPTSKQLFTKEVVLTRLQDNPVQNTECNVSQHQYESNMMCDHSISVLSKEKSECSSISKQDVLIHQVEFEMKSNKETDLDKSSLISVDADEDKLNFLQGRLQEIHPEHGDSKMPQQTANLNVCASNTKIKVEDDLQHLQKSKDELELCKESCFFSCSHLEASLPESERCQECLRETCCSLDCHLSTKNTDCCRNSSITTTSKDAKSSLHEEQMVSSLTNFLIKLIKDIWMQVFFKDLQVKS
ncbi:uncharacterized protein KIAA0232-like isoform X2 [Pristis pectinata]|uniref:uncharacterized protein KIAA0232-like isoform X2 n=1 Tax=Pristis pectinata TaxID=685728 RepID=UPI00223DD69B|nr:uncharacterized protein KIAA0232-like isoform X2 [Pristis pectinata]